MPAIVLAGTPRPGPLRLLRAPIREFAWSKVRAVEGLLRRPAGLVSHLLEDGRLSGYMSPGGGSPGSDSNLSCPAHSEAAAASSGTGGARGIGSSAKSSNASRRRPT